MCDEEEGGSKQTNLERTRDQFQRCTAGLTQGSQPKNQNERGAGTGAECITTAQNNGRDIPSLSRSIFERFRHSISHEWAGRPAVVPQAQHHAPILLDSGPQTDVIARWRVQKIRVAEAREFGMLPVKLMFCRLRWPGPLAPRDPLHLHAEIDR
jgi:hypothetical protein